VSITIAGYQFDGPYILDAELKHASGVYVILCWANGRYSNVDVGESGDIQDRIATHERRPYRENTGRILGRLDRLSISS
jgi:hypothetical protein